MPAGPAPRYVWVIVDPDGQCYAAGRANCLTFTAINDAERQAMILNAELSAAGSAATWRVQIVRE